MSIIQEIKEEIQAAYREPSSRDLTILALLFLVFPGIVGLYLVYWKGSGAGYTWITVGVILSILRLIPPVFRLVYRAWIGISIIIGYFISRAILTVIFFVVITPTGLIFRIIGKDPMERKIDPSKESYWQKREQEQDTSIERYEKQF
jgi:hypothetical protein|uniref:SxtJ n=1 Tax=Desulfomonile tiedjei TaxID=2358 RepID=A0A7C4AQU2_9BACT